MKGLISKTRARCTPLILTKGSEEKLLDSAVSKSVESELPSSQQVPALAPQNPLPDPSLELARKRKQSIKSRIDTPPTKKSRSTRQIIYTDAQPLRRSLRLQGRHHNTAIEDPVRVLPPTAPHTYRIETSGGSIPLKLKRYELTAKNLRSFNKRNRQLLKTMGKTSQFKGRKSLTISSSYMRTNAEGGKSAQLKTTSTTSAGFAALAFENGVLDRMSSKAPANYHDRRIRLNRDRETASPTESEYGDYVAAVSLAPNEQTMIMETAGLLKKPSYRGYRRVFNQTFTGFPKEVGFNNGLSAPQPDLVEGLQRRQFKPFPIEEKIDGAVLFKNDAHSLTLPHLAGEWKGPGKDMIEARVQSAYDGAALVYGRDRALEVMKSPDPPGHAAVVSFTTDGSNINFFTHHSATSEEDGKTYYHQFPIGSTNLLNSFEEFKQGQKQLRNLQDDARRESYMLRDRLNEYWKPKKAAASSLPGTGASPPKLGSLSVDNFALEAFRAL